MEDSEVIEEENTVDFTNLDISNYAVNRIRNMPQSFEYYDMYDNKPVTFYTKLKRHFQVFMPHFGLWILTVLYIMAGATYFWYHESAFEVESRNQALSEFLALKNNFNNKLLTLKQSNVSREMFSKTQQELFESIVSQIYFLQQNQYISTNHIFNKTNTDNEQLWSYSNSIFFATTIITTIGYTKKFSPATIYAKIGCIIFASFGIPLFLVSAADIGKFLSEFFLCFYRKYRNLKSCILQLLQKATNWDIISISSEESDIYFYRIPGTFVLIFVLGYISIGGLLLKFLKEWSFMDSIFVCFNVLTRIGHNNKVPSENDNPFIIIAYIFLGISLAIICIDIYGSEYINKLHYFGTRIDRIILRIKNFRKKDNCLEENGDKQ